jgi:hypothetical protein
VLSLGVAKVTQILLRICKVLQPGMRLYNVSSRK